MEILIDMDMPKRCEECEFYKHNSGYDFVYCFLTATNIMGCANARLNNCPLREVVRCKDCKNASESLVPESVYCDEMDRAVYIQGFCHHGERRGRMSVEEMIGKTISDVKVDGNR